MKASIVESGEYVRFTASSGFSGKSENFSGACTPVTFVPLGITSLKQVSSVYIPLYVNATSLSPSHL